MANHGCINGTLEGTNYSSPVPIIGLYIAAASLVCMLMMLYDTIAGFRARQRWLPCKSFSLNSVTLTLLSIAAKLSVDLTTPMPSVWDQVSKLSSTALICVSMGFLLPSLGITSKTECFTNLVALTIFIVTIVVNICIQISTGVIVLFIAEHIVLLCFMLVLLMMFWSSYWDIHNTRKISIDENKVIFTKGEGGGMLERLKKSYLFGYCSNPQFVLCSQWAYTVFGLICPICSFILAYDVLKSLVQKQLKFCSGVSDYDWSMTIIVVTQLLAVVVGSFSVCFRWVALIPYSADDDDILLDLVDKDTDKVIENNPTLGYVSTKLDYYGKFARDIYLFTIGLLHILIVCIPLLVVSTIVLIWMDEDTQQWKKRKSSEDMERWMEASKSTGSSHQVSSLLSRIRPSQQQQQFHTMEIRDEVYPNRAEGVKVSCLSITLLVRTAQVSLPSTLSDPLLLAFIEANETMHFIEKTMNPKSIQNDQKLLLAKAVWAGADFSCLLDEIFNNDQPAPQSELDRAVVIITKLKSALPYDVVWDELGIIVDFINRKSYSSIEDLGASIEQLFVDMLHQMLAQLPHAIFKLLSDSHDEEYQGSVKLALKFLCKVEAIEDQIQWSFPEGSGITRLITEERQNEVADTAGRNEDVDSENHGVKQEEGKYVVSGGPIANDCVIIPVA